MLKQGLSLLLSFSFYTLSQGICLTSATAQIPSDGSNSITTKYDIDEKWFQQSLVEDNLSHWLNSAITNNGFFRVTLNRQWQPAAEQTATLVSQSRLLYVMAEGYQITQNQKYLDAVKKGADFLLANFRKDEGEWYWSVSPEGELIDETESPYGYAFAIFGLSHAHRVTGYEPYLDAAMTTALQLDLWADIKTFPNKRPEDSWTQNHMMHTFEALLVLHDVTKDNQILENARLLADFIFDQLYQQEDGYLPEAFDANWKPLKIEEGGYVDIGHQVEWAFFLSRAVAEKGFPEHYLDIGGRLLNFGLQNGYDHEQGGIFNRSSYSGQISNSDKVWWGQSEFIRAVMQYASFHDRQDLWPQYQQTLQFVQKYFLDSEYGGWFSEPIDPRLPNDEHLKGHIWKAGYHVIGMYVHALQLYEQGLVE
ncbi:N-acyl-D-glucosamine 2-epimerase [Xenococcus sp. PCC 7305]|uniref:AGE family epimerase/isomerase n=1 Tax=Xenococcus sp. PCC 7305 TaxID=102125 RepID=UPI0002AC4B3A|nr:AGE family epimerase/isomerase [Xenococcus sp. PCC 7305]ELS01769.1 N-acyl-D-glucosamine 2-epimerase [Xenococcus sp. PCC 7305]